MWELIQEMLSLATDIVDDVNEYMERKKVYHDYIAQWLFRTIS